jgi:hypothetical protein
MYAIYSNDTENGFSGDFNYLTNKPELSDVATSGNYNDLINCPIQASVTAIGSYNDLSILPTTDESETQIISADGLSVEGNGTSESPYQLSIVEDTNIIMLTNNMVVV